MGKVYAVFKMTDNGWEYMFHSQSALKARKFKSDFDATELGQVTATRFDELIDRGDA